MNTSAYIYCYKHTHTTCVRQCSHVWTYTNTHTQTHRYTHTNKHLLEWANIAPSCPCKILNCCNSTRNIRNCCKKSSVPYSARRRCVDCNLKSQYATKFTTSTGKIYYQHPRHAAQHTDLPKNGEITLWPACHELEEFGFLAYLVVKFPNSRFCWHTYDTLPITWILEL